MKITRIVGITIAIALSSSGIAQAQFGRGGGGGGGFGQPAFGQPSNSGGSAAAEAKPVWAQFKMNPGVRVTLDFRNASIDAVIDYLSKQSGVAIVKDPSLTGGITLESPKPQSLDDAFSMFSVVLGLHNPAFELEKQGDFMLVAPKQPTFNPASMRAFGGASNAGFRGGNQNVLQVYTLKYASATTLATVINQVFTQTTAAPVTGPGGPGGFAARFAALTVQPNVPLNAPQVHASADDYSNSIIVNAPEAEQGEIATIIDTIDEPTQQPETARVFPLKYAIASDLEPEIQSVLSGTVPLGRAATASTASQQRNQQGGGGRFGGFFARFNNNNNNTNNGNGTVTADTRSNSLIVTSTPDNLDDVAQVIQQLDQPEQYESTTFVYTMKNARADVVANLLNEAFGNRTTNGPEGGSLTNPTFTSSNLGTSTSSTSTSSRAGGTNGTFTVTATNNNNTNEGDTAGLSQTGQIVNVQNLTGEVLLVPNIDTNSIIVVTQPEYKDTVEKILEQMDQIPGQVMIQTLVVETTLDKADSLGVEYNFSIPGLGQHGMFGGSQDYGTVSTPVTTSSTGVTTGGVSAQNAALGLPAGAQFTLSAGGYSAVLSAIEQDSKFNVLSTPRIFTTNNATAQINISQEIPYVTSSSADLTTGATTYSYDFMNVGIVLTVTPRITSNGYVTMDVDQTANDFVSYTSFNAPVVNQRETQSTISVQNGRTVVLGGIISDQVNDTVNKIPLLGDIPILGDLFRSTSKSNDKTELLVFLTPTVVTQPSDAQAVLQETEKDASATDKNFGKTVQQMAPSMSTAVVSPAPTAAPEPAPEIAPAPEASPSLTNPAAPQAQPAPTSAPAPEAQPTPQAPPAVQPAPAETIPAPEATAGP